MTIAKRALILSFKRCLKKVLRPVQSFVLLAFYQKDLESFFVRIFSPAELTMLPGSRTLLEHLTGAKFEQFRYFFDARKQLIQLGRKLDHGHGIANLPKSVQHREPLSLGKPLKILYISGMFPSFEHGGGLRLFDIISELSKKHSIDLYAKFHEGLDGKSLDLLRSKLANLRCTERLSEKELLSWLERRGIREGYYDIIQLEYPQSVAFLQVARKFGKRVGFTLMECVTLSRCLSLLSTIRSDPRQIGPLLAEILHFGSVECAGMRGSDFSIALTREDAEFSANLARVRPEVISTGLSSLLLDECESPLVRDQAPEGPFAAFVGFFGHYPNIEGISWYIRNIHSAVVRAIPGYKLLVIGAGDTSRLRALSQGDPSIVFTGRVDALALEIRRAAICIAPLISGAGLRGKVNQYAICERPTISTSIGAAGTPYVSGESILTADQVGEFSRHMIELLRDEALRTKIAKRAKEVVEQHFCWKRIIPQLESIYYGC